MGFFITSAKNDQLLVFWYFSTLHPFDSMWRQKFNTKVPAPLRSRQSYRARACLTPKVHLVWQNKACSSTEHFLGLGKVGGGVVGRVRWLMNRCATWPWSIIIILRCLEVVNELYVSAFLSPSDKWYCNDPRIATEIYWTSDEDEISTTIPGTSVLRGKGELENKVRGQNLRFSLSMFMI